MMSDGSITSEELSRALAERISALDASGPSLRSVLALSESAIDEARELDAERRAGRVRSPLHGLPILLKDNIDTAGPLGTTAGSFLLSAEPPARDASLVAQVRRAGLVVLGKSNLSEWANFRGRPSSSGWSPVGGQTLNPHGLDRSPGGSSSGSAAALAARLAPLAIGTETDGSIMCPAAACGVVGMKPTVGLVSRTGIVPISASQDTAGPMARSVEDLAGLLAILALSPDDGEDAAMAARPWSSDFDAPNYLEMLDPDLRGRRVGVVEAAGYQGYHASADALMGGCVQGLRAAGAEVVRIEEMSNHSHDDEMVVLCYEFKQGLDAYLSRRAADRSSAGLGANGTPASLDEIVELTLEAERERVDVFPINVLERAAGTGPGDRQAYVEAREANWRRTRADGIDDLCGRLGLDALIALTMVPTWPIDHVNGDSHSGSAWSQAAVAGYPSITLPIGDVHGLPVGAVIWGRAWSEPVLLQIAFGLERQLSYAPVPSFADRASIVASL